MKAEIEVLESELCDLPLMNLIEDTQTKISAFLKNLNIVNQRSNNMAYNQRHRHLIRSILNFLNTLTKVLNVYNLEEEKLFFSTSQAGAENLRYSVELLSQCAEDIYDFYFKQIVLENKESLLEKPAFDIMPESYKEFKKVIASQDFNISSSHRKDLIPQKLFSKQESVLWGILCGGIAGVLSVASLGLFAIAVGVAVAIVVGIVAFNVPNMPEQEMTLPDLNKELKDAMIELGNSVRLKDEIIIPDSLQKTEKEEHDLIIGMTL